MHRQMDAALLDPGTLSDSQEEEWRGLVARAVEPNLAFEPEAVLPSVAHVPGWSAVRLLVATDGDRFAGCLPLRLQPRQRNFPVPSATTRLDGTSVPLLPVLGTPLLDRTSTDAALATLLDALTSRDLTWPGGAGPSVVFLDRWHAGGEVAGRWRAACAERGLRLVETDHWQRPALSRDAGETWPACLGRRRLAESGRKARRLAEALGGPVRCVDRAGDPRAVDDFLRLEASGWKGRAGTALLGTVGRAAAFGESCRRWAASGRLAMLTLEADGIPVAMRCAVRSGDHLFLHKIAYHDDYARFGPGVQLELATGEHFMTASEARWMDPCCAPSNTFYPDFLPHRLSVASAATAVRTDGAAVLAIRALASRLRHSARRARLTARSVARSPAPPVATTTDATARRSG